MNRNYLISVLLLLANSTTGQSITQATFGSMGGQFRNGNVILAFTIGETLVGAQSSGPVRLGSGFWAIVPTSYVPMASIVYRFTGNGNFFHAANWQGGLLPPNPLPPGSEIIIEPVGNGECVLNSPYSISAGTKFSIMAGKRFLIPGNLLIVNP